MSADSMERFDGQWWLVHAKPRNEKALAKQLSRLDITHFLPLTRVARTYGDRTVHVQLPLFPGYMFVRGGEDARYATLMTHRAVNVIHVGDQERLRADLGHIFRIVSGDQPVDVYPGIRKGCRCRVVRGPLMGLEGVVLRRRSICRVYVAVDVLGQSVEVEIDAAQLEIID